MKSLAELRAEIDRVNAEMAMLFRERMDLVREVGKSKAANGTAVNDPKRENAILAQVAGIVGEEYAEDARKLFRLMFELAKAREMTV